MEFKSVIYDYEKNDPNITLPEFMERIALLAEVDNHDADENAVVLMTMHSAKGLEFPFVFLPGLEEWTLSGMARLRQRRRFGRRTQIVLCGDHACQGATVADQCRNANHVW